MYVPRASRTLSHVTNFVGLGLGRRGEGLHLYAFVRLKTTTMVEMFALYSGSSQSSSLACVSSRRLFSTPILIRSGTRFSPSVMKMTGRHAASTAHTAAAVLGLTIAKDAADKKSSRSRV